MLLETTDLQVKEFTLEQINVIQKLVLRLLHKNLKACENITLTYLQQENQYTDIVIEYLDKIIAEHSQLS